MRARIAIARAAICDASMAGMASSGMEAKPLTRFDKASTAGKGSVSKTMVMSETISIRAGRLSPLRIKALQS